MRREQIAVQLYSLRDQMTSREEIAATLQALADNGIKAVELAGMGDYSAEEYRAMCDKLGITICSSHEGGDDLFDKTDEVIAKLSILGCEHVAYPWPHLPHESFDDYIGIAKKMNAAGEKLADAGISLSYHNHAMEFERHEGIIGMDILADYTIPAYVSFQPDTYWVQTGGMNPAEFCERNAGRIAMLHCKEYGIVEGKVSTPACGDGNLDWETIIPTAEMCGAEWFIIEQEGSSSMTLFEAVVRSFEYLSELADN